MQYLNNFECELVAENYVETFSFKTQFQIDFQAPIEICFNVVFILTLCPTSKQLYKLKGTRCLRFWNRGFVVVVKLYFKPQDIVCL